LKPEKVTVTDSDTRKEAAPYGSDFDHRDHESAYSPWARWARLRAEAPIAHSQKYGGFHVVSRYEDVCAVARDQQIFSSALRQTTIPQLASPPFPPIHYDQPEHRNYRVIVNPMFAPGKIREFEPWIDVLAERYVSRVLASKSFDFPVDLGIPLTREVILRIMGIEEAPVEVNEWSDDLVYQHPNAAEAAGLLMGFLGEQLAKRRKSPGDDLFSHLIAARYEGNRPLDDSEILRTSLLVLLAGLDTTNSAMSGAVWYLVQHPQALAELKNANAETWRLAMDEFVRWTSPAPAQARTARTDATIAGCPVKAGEMVLMLLGSANRDETEFEHPDDVILDRHPNHHVGFGHGPHRCIGMHLAKLEMELVFRRLVKGLEAFRLSDPSAVKWIGAEVRSITSLPLVRT
jgi:cytochrome P450